MINNLINKLTISKKNNQKCIFSSEEKDYIYEQKIDLLPLNNEQNELNKLLFLICNIENNLDEKYILYIKRILSMLNCYFQDEEISSFNYFGLPITSIKEKLKFKNKFLTFEQNAVLELYNSYNVCLKAGTGSGKTFLSSYFLVERYISWKKESNNKEQKFIFIVPTEILEDQIIYELKQVYKDDVKSDVIGNSIEENEILIITCEKLISHINVLSVDININTLIIDEAHLLFNEDDVRSKFMQHTLSQYFSLNGYIEKLILISPFDLEIKKVMQALKLENLISEKTFINIEIDNKNKNNKINFNMFESIENNEKEFENIIFNNTDSVVCIYCKNKVDTKRIAKKWFSKKEYLNSINKAQINELTEEKVEEIKSSFTKSEYKIYSDYINFEYIKNGICYLTADVPDFIKLKIIELVKKRYIRLVVATYLIVAGVDLPFDFTLMDSIKVNDKELPLDDIVNFFGRAGRINWFKKSYGSAFSYIKLTKKEQVWWNKNKEELRDRLDNKYKPKVSFVDSDENNFIFQSYKKYDETNDKKYLLDPRINPRTTDNISQIANNENYLFLIKKFFNRDKSINSLNKDILLFLLLYNFHEYITYYSEENIKFNDFKSWFNGIEFDEKIIYENITNKDLKIKVNKINKNLNWFAKYDFNIEKSLNAYLNYLLKNNNNNYSENLEEFVSINKNYGKFLFMMFLNHFWLLINKPKYTSIQIYSTFHIINYDFYDFIKKYNYSKEILDILKYDCFLVEWKFINSIENDIEDICDQIFITNFLKVLPSGDKFLDDLKKYINDKKNKNRK